MNATKAILRRRLLQERQSLGRAEVRHKSARIERALLELVDWKATTKLHIYCSVSAWNEVDTSGIITQLRRTYPQIVIVTRPARTDEPLPIEQFDLIIVPVLGFDTDNYRLGLGGGWYDRFLARQPQARTIGLAYGFAKVDSLPHETHDIALDTVITDL